MNWREQFHFGILEIARKWWQERQAREQWLLIGCVIFLIGYGTYALYAAYQSKVTQIQIEIEDLESDLIWIVEKHLDALTLEKQGGSTLNDQQLEAFIHKQLTSSKVFKQSKVTARDTDWQVIWQGSKPSTFVQAVSAMSLGGVHIVDFQLDRKSGNIAKIVLTVTN